MRIGVIAAVPLELKHIVRGWEPVRQADRRVKVWTRVDEAGDTLIAACAGMGAEAVRRAFAAAEQGGGVDVVLSVGLAGATDAALRVGSVSVLSEVIDSQTGERFTLTDGNRRLRIVSLGRVADAKEKRRLLATYGAVMVDMESATVARMAQQRGIPMCCIKAVSDTAEAVLPDVNPYLREGQLRMGAFLVSVAVRPRTWAPLLRLGRDSARGAERLGKVIDHVLLQKDWVRVNRTGVVFEE